MFSTSRRARSRDVFVIGHHAARQRKAMFRTRLRARSRDVFVIGHHAARQRGAMFRTSVVPAHATSSSSATTLLASVEPCSAPDFAPPRDLIAHHAACQRGAMFSTRLRARSRDVFVIGHHAARQRGAMFSTRLRPTTPPLRPPRCSPAWSHVQHQTSPHHATPSATTLLASVEPCSEPDFVPAHATSSSSATTLLASVEPCSAPDFAPPLRPAS